MRRSDQVMFPQQHPLDEEIADFAAGTLAPESAEAVSVHLAGCLLCRIKRQRFAAQPAFTLTALAEVEMPRFEAIELRIEAGSSAEPGDLWVTDGPDGIVVLVRSVEEGDAIVVPVVVDIEVADEECQVITAQMSPLGVAIAVYSRLAVNVPVSALARRVEPRREIDLLNLADGDGISRGAQITEQGDPRLEIRQWLVDRLTSLASHHSEVVPPSKAQVGATEQYRQLEEALSNLRMSACVEPFTNLRIADAGERRWAGIARVDELGVVVIAIDAPGRLTGQLEFRAAHTLLTRCNASALAVATTECSDLCELYEASGLFGATHVPDGRMEHRTALSDMPLPETIAKYLDNKLKVPFGAGTSTRGQHVKVEDILVKQVSIAIDSTVAAGARARREAKKDGYSSVNQSHEKLVEVLRGALANGLDPDEVANIAREVEP